ncbi:Polygalacturonase [Capsicum annuum]|nr:Polygalacturonase [Capsicum annuum]KAF3669659.1 Polygalacturonase [Capsicum annuum]
MEKILRLLCVICVIITSILLLDSHSINVEGRHHISKKTNSKIVSYAPITIEGCVNEPLPSPLLSLAASPSNVAPSENPDLSPDYIFDVMEYGAVGDGSTDDMDAFIETWKDACKVESAVLLVPADRPCDSPTMIGFIQSSNLVVKVLRVQNSPMFHMIFDECEGVLIDQLSISSPKLSPNTDGIHIENTKSVGIYNSVIATGDDCISIGPGSSNINIEGVICGPSHEISDTIACINITLSKVELLPHEGDLVADPFCWNTYGIQQTIMVPPIDCLYKMECHKKLETLLIIPAV